MVRWNEVGERKKNRGLRRRKWGFSVMFLSDEEDMRKNGKEVEEKKRGRGWSGTYEPSLKWPIVDVRPCVHAIPALPRTRKRSVLENRPLLLAGSWVCWTQTCLTSRHTGSRYLDTWAWLITVCSVCPYGSGRSLWERKSIWTCVWFWMVTEIELYECSKRRHCEL